MWFKRRKNSQQDHALSESLRSLQSLLNETGRREPYIDARDDELNMSDTPGGRAPELADGAEAAPGGELDATGPAPPEPGNRWQELSLSFDAEPLIPNPVEPAFADDSKAAEDPQETTQANIEWDEDQNDTEPVVSATSPLWPGEDNGAPEVPLEVRDAGQDYVEDDNEAGPSSGAGPEETAEPVLQPAGPSASDAPDAELELHSLDTDQDEPALPGSGRIDDSDPGDEDITVEPMAEIETLPEPEPETRPQAPPSAATARKRRLENQLPLQLEPTDEPVGADIPTLTETVYVPDAPQKSLIEEIEELRSRLRNVDLDALSPERQAQLYKGLSELLDKLD